jgi:RND superfamily putative drug exporter
MHGFGRANWWLPKWLDKILPHLAVEPAEKKK